MVNMNFERAMEILNNPQLYETDEIKEAKDFLKEQDHKADLFDEMATRVYKADNAEGDGEETTAETVLSIIRHYVFSRHAG